MKKLIFLLAILALAACSDSPVGPVSPAENGEDENDTTVVEKSGNSNHDADSEVVAVRPQHTDSGWYIIPGENLEINVVAAGVSGAGLVVYTTDNLEDPNFGYIYHVDCGNQVIHRTDTTCHSPIDHYACDLVVTKTVNGLPETITEFIPWEGEYRVHIDYFACYPKD